MRECWECGTAFKPVRHTQHFCCSQCRRDFNNRRAERGAELYDLFMTMRFDRERAAADKLFGQLSAMASAYRDDDMAERAGRRSWDINATRRTAGREGHSLRGVDRRLARAKRLAATAGTANGKGEPAAS